MRIIAGEYRGRPIKAPAGLGTRPTIDRVRESLMSSVISARGGLEGAVVLDAFAGSGALGLEALSRGAQSVHFCERDGAALRVVNENVRTLGLGVSCAHLVRADVFKTPPHAHPPFDLVFFDPPYECKAQDVLGIIDKLAASASLAPEALVVYEHALKTNDEADKAAAFYGLTLASRKKYGDTIVDILRSSTRGANAGEIARCSPFSSELKQEEETELRL